GAGISVASGLSAFRDEKGKHTSQDLLDRNIVNNNKETQMESLKMLYLMAMTAAKAEPSDFHKMMLSIKRQGRLCRVYTQNIDGLERKVGLDDQCCIQLHGSLQRLRCHQGHVLPLSELLADLSPDKMPQCLQCSVPDQHRNNPRPARNRHPIYLDYDIIMYGDHHPDQADIGAMLSADLCRADLLVVVGTSLTTETAKKVPKKHRRTI
ncbi:DHS-like NAD/FAD-binding domain-containing protein, partial [Mycena floridula]